MDDLGVFAPSFGHTIERPVGGQHFREPDDGVERRAQLVADRRQKAALGLPRLLGGEPRRLEVVGAALLFSDVPGNGDNGALGRPAGTSALGRLDTMGTGLGPDHPRRGGI